MKFKLKIKPGEIVPKLYGAAYYEALSNILICYPVPINYAIAFFRWIWLELRHPYFFRVTDAFELGRKKGRDDTNERHRRVLFHNSVIPLYKMTYENGEIVKIEEVEK